MPSTQSLVSALVCAAALLPALSLATPLDDYVSAPDENYQWHDTNATFKTLLGGKAHVLNVTSQKWLDVTQAHGPDGDLWTHQVLVVVPANVKHTTVSLAYLTGNCNSKPSVPGPTDEELLIVDTTSHDTGTIGIIVYQLPNCPIIYPSDPSQKGRTEDSMIAWAWNEFFSTPDHDPRWLPRLPMVKAAMQSMRAAEAFIATLNVGKVGGWLVAGASKRGWTTWMVGAVTCPTCVTIKAIAPLVPIVPALRREIHRMYQAYGGFTFAFKDYQDGLNLTTHIDDPIMGRLLDIVDPINYKQRLARLPVYVVDSSDDEFMMMDWTNIWYDEMKAALPELHLLIAPNSEHSLATGVPEVVESLGAFVASLAAGEPIGGRPNFVHTQSNSTGEIVVKIDPGFKPTAVTLRYADTLQDKRRDFRWVRLASPEVGNCTLPDIALPKPIFGANCLVPIVWKTQVLTPSRDTGTYHAVAPAPKKEGHWVAYYIEMKFKTTHAETQYHITTPGYVWPPTLPFPDCKGTACIGPLV